MKTADMTRRIDAVAEGMKTLRIKGTTRLDWNCLTHEEKTLFEKVWQIKEEYLPYAPPDNVLEENPARFIIPEWASRPEYSCVQRNDKNGMGVKFDLFSFLEGLPWGPNLSIHAIKLRFEVYSFHWLGDGWTYSKRSHSYRRLFNLSYPINVQCFDTGTVLVSVKSSVRPFNLDLSGLLSLTSLLGELRERLRATCIPEPTNWLIVQWHLNRDSEPISIDGISFHVTFRDFFHNVARLYYKNELERVRAEAIQSPKRTIKNLLESVLNRGQQI